MTHDFGEIAFNAYVHARNGVAWDGGPIPPWAELPADVRAGWVAVGAAVHAHIMVDLTTLVVEMTQLMSDAGATFGVGGRREGVDDRGQAVQLACERLGVPEAIR